MRGAHLDQRLPDFQRALICMLLRDPPYEIDWMEKHAARDDIECAMIEPSRSFDEFDRLKRIGL